MKENEMYQEFEKPIRELEKKIRELEEYSAKTGIDLTGEVSRLKGKTEEMKKNIYSTLTPWQRVLLARDPNRPLATDFIKLMMDEFLELHGDKMYKDDNAIVCGLAKIAHHRFMLVGHRKGKNTQERLACNFGSAHPEGYRKAMEKMKFAEKFKLPIVTFINTPGAYPGIGAEERGQASAIARNLYDMSILKTPILCVIIGEGGSGGALGIGVGDRIAILENAYYSVISPEGCAAILWRNGAKAPDAAMALKLSPPELKKHGIVDDIVPEPLGGAHRDHNLTASNFKKYIIETLDQLVKIPIPELLEKRYQKYRKIGYFIEKETNKIMDMAAKKK